MFNLACACSALGLVVEHILNVIFAEFSCLLILFLVSINGIARVTISFISSLGHPGMFVASPQLFRTNFNRLVLCV